jgi:hypothetical protein
MEKKTFDIVILNGRPAAGKSEIIDYLKKIPVEERIRRFHIGDFQEIDDFPFLWEQFEDDDLLEDMGQNRILTDREFEYKGKVYPGYAFKYQWYWNFLIRKIDHHYSKFLRDYPDFHKNNNTIFIEFARGSEHGGFATAYQYLSDTILGKAVTLYIHVTWEESLRKNRRRFNPDKPDSILEHGLEDIKLEKLYKESDWEKFSADDPDYLLVKGRRIPYGIFDNMPEKTDKPDVLGRHLDQVLGKLWNVYTKR